MKQVTSVILMLCLAVCSATALAGTQDDFKKLGVRTKSPSSKIENTVEKKVTSSANTAVLTEDGKILLIHQEPSILRPVDSHPVSFLYRKEESLQ